MYPLTHECVWNIKVNDNVQTGPCWSESVHVWLWFGICDKSDCETVYCWVHVTTFDLVAPFWEINYLERYSASIILLWNFCASS